MVNVMYPYQKAFYENGKAEGKAEGVLKRSQEDILEILEERFYVVPDFLKEAIENILDQGILKFLHKATVRVASLVEFEKAMQDCRK